MKHIVISGATSFIGLHLMQRLAKLDYQISAFVRPNSSKIKQLPQSDRIQVISCELHEYAEIIKQMSLVDVLIHFAWDGTRGVLRDDAERQENCYRASSFALQSALSRGCTRVISAGSQAEYGVYDGKISEDTACNPITAYGKSKLQFYKEGTKACIQSGAGFWEPRFFSLYGEGDAENTMIMRIARAMLNNERCELTECTQIWNFLYISDAVDGILRLMELPECEAGVYNFAHWESKPLRHYVEDMRKILNSSSVLSFGAIPFPASGPVSIQAEVNKLLKTGWKPQIVFQDGINRIRNSIQEQNP